MEIGKVPENVLKRAVEEAKKMGYTFQVGPECEFFLFHADENGLPTTVTHEQAGYFDIGPLDLGENARREMILTLEEMGFVVAATVIITYVVLITRAVFIAKTARDNLGSYIAIGIAGIFLFHMTENIGMTMGLLPITGVPLPFVSYGGSSLLTNLMMIGLLLNISGRRQKAIFVD